jgi:SulP family sulfate permease
MHTPLRRQLQRQEFSFDRVVVFDDLSDGMQYVEDLLIGTENEEVNECENPIGRQLNEYFDPNSLNHLLEYLSKEEVQLGGVIFRRGESGDHLYFIAKGQVSVVTSLDNNANVRLAAYSDGTVIGEMAVLSGSTRSAYVVASSDCVLYKLTRSDIERMGRECSATLVQLQQYLLITLTNRFSSMSQTIEIIM